MSIENWNEDSILSRSGYTADGSLSQYQRISCINHAIDNRLESALEVLRHLRWLRDDRGDRYPRALKIWLEDTEYVSRVINNENLTVDAGAASVMVADIFFQQVARDHRSRSVFEEFNK